MEVAIIGTGISGLGVAHLLTHKHNVTVYEKNNYIGGHSRTINVPTGNISTPVDTGFIVFNGLNYPHLMGLFKHLNVPFEKSDMSFGVSINNAWLEYGSDHIFAQRKNYFRLRFWRMILDIARFNTRAFDLLKKYPDSSLGEFLNHLGVSKWFQQYYLLAMGAAIWSCPVKTILQFPAKTYLQFFKNHGLLTLNDHPQWYSVSGGSREYVERLTASLTTTPKLNSKIRQVQKRNDKYAVVDEQGHADYFDQVIFACHADEALDLIDKPSIEERNILGAFKYQKNKIVVHSDLEFMPKNRKCWSSWVYLSDDDPNDLANADQAVSLSYWMNNLQNIDHRYPIIVTLNPGRRPDEKKIMDEHTFTHPIFDYEAIKAQEKIDSIQGKRGLWFCGAYQRYGFHEDGLLSAVSVVEKMGITVPWK